MNEENKNLNENNETPEAEVIETAEAVETTEATEAVETTEAAEAVEPAEEKKKPTGMIIGAIVLIVVIAAAICCKFYGGKLFNKYNRMGYINTTGNTIADIADAEGMTLEEFLEEYQLPKDMPANTEESTAYYSIPTGKMAEMYGVDFETLKTELQISEDVTEETPWGEAEGTIKVGVYVGGEENLANFKEYYGLGDEVTADTPWEEIRNKVDQKNKEDNEAAKKEKEEAAKATEAPAEETTEAPAEDAAEAPEADAAAPAENTAAQQ